MEVICIDRVIAIFLTVQLMHYDEKESSVFLQFGVGGVLGLC